MANRPDWQDGRGPLLRRELDRIYTAIWPLFTPRLTYLSLFILRLGLDGYMTALGGH